MSSVVVKRMAVVGWDALSWVLAALAYFLVRFDLTLSERVWEGVLLYTGLAIVLQVAAGFLFHLYLGRSRLGSFDEVTLLGTIVAGVSVVAGASIPAHPTGVLPGCGSRHPDAGSAHHGCRPMGAPHRGCGVRARQRLRVRAGARLRSRRRGPPGGAPPGYLR